MASVSTKKQAYQLIALFFCAITLGIGFAVYGAYSMGPQGHYLAKNVLVSPDLLPNLSYRANDAVSGKAVKFHFDKIEFTYYDAAVKGWKTKGVEMKNYAKFYDLIRNEKSMSDQDVAIQNQFQHPNLSRLILRVKSEENGSSLIFQEVQFIPEGDYFRVELRQDDSAKAPWAYFYHPQIAKMASDLFTAG